MKYPNKLSLQKTLTHALKEGAKQHWDLWLQDRRPHRRVNKAAQLSAHAFTGTQNIGEKKKNLVVCFSAPYFWCRHILEFNIKTLHCKPCTYSFTSIYSVYIYIY